MLPGGGPAATTAGSTADLTLSPTPGGTQLGYVIFRSYDLALATVKVKKMREFASRMPRSLLRGTSLRR